MVFGKPSPTVDELGIGFVPWSPLGQGFLTGKVDATMTFDCSDRARLVRAPASERPKCFTLPSQIRSRVPKSSKKDIHSTPRHRHRSTPRGRAPTDRGGTLTERASPDSEHQSQPELNVSRVCRRGNAPHGGGHADIARWNAEVWMVEDVEK